MSSTAGSLSLYAARAAFLGFNDNFMKEPTPTTRPAGSPLGSNPPRDPADLPRPLNDRISFSFLTALSRLSRKPDSNPPAAPAPKPADDARDE